MMSKFKIIKVRFEKIKANIYVSCIYSSSNKVQNGNILLTTHRVLFYIDNECLEVPLYNVSSFEKLVSHRQKKIFY